MTRAELRSIIVTQLDGAVGSASDQYWGPAELNIYIQEALNEIAKRTLCLKDSITPAFCQINMVADQVHYPFPDGVLEIDAIEKSWDNRELARTTNGSAGVGWKQTTSEPCKYLTDFSLDTISLVGRLATVTTEKLNLTVRRMPAVMLVDSATIDLPMRFQMKTLNWVLYRCFSKQDAEIYNPSKAENHRLAFEGPQQMLGKGGDIGQIIDQLNQFQPRVSKVRYF